MLQQPFDSFCLAFLSAHIKSVHAMTSSKHATMVHVKHCPAVLSAHSMKPVHALNSLKLTKVVSCQRVHGSADSLCQMMQKMRGMTHAIWTTMMHRAKPLAPLKRTSGQSRWAHFVMPQQTDSQCRSIVCQYQVLCMKVHSACHWHH